MSDQSTHAVGRKHIEDFMRSKSFAGYMQTQGVREYKHFAGLPDDYEPSQSDAAMAMVESLGRAHCESVGIQCDASGAVFAGGEMIGRSKLAQGKACKDLSISLWLEDVGQMGFSVGLLRAEMDEKLGDGWFDRNVTPLIDKKRTQANRTRELDEYAQRKPMYKPWWRTALTKIAEWPSRYRVRAHYKKLEAR